MSDFGGLVVITGGPGSGKSTLIEQLAQRGFAAMPEGSRAIVQDWKTLDRPGLPGDDVELFTELVLHWELRSYRDAQQYDGPVFFDRGIPDLAGNYIRTGHSAIPLHVERAATVFRYHPQVFIAPPWPEIYHTDAERTWSYDDAVRVHRSMCEAYPRYGYELVELPKTTVATRAAFILETLNIPYDSLGSVKLGDTLRSSM